MARKDDNLTRYLSDCVRYGYYTNEELKRVSESPILKHETYSREYTIEANVRNARYQIQRESIKGNVYVVPHYACRPQHIKYQDMVYSKKLFDEKIAYPNNPDGIGCVNCRHEVVEHYDGIEEQYDSTYRNTDELIEQYNDEQKMRRYENEIRKLKLAGEGNDEQLRRGYARLMEHSRATNTPIQINRTWTINASRYNVSMPNKRLDVMNLLPRYTNESFDYGFVKTTARMKGKRASYFIDGIDISDCNFFPESVRTAYTGRAYGIGKDMSEEAFKSSMETIIHTSQSDGIRLMWADKTTTNVLNATGCFFIPEATAVDDVNPFEIYEDITNHEVPREKLTPTSYGIYVDDDEVWRFFYADKLPDSDHIYDLSREPNRSKVTPKIMDTSIKTYKELFENDYLRYRSKSSLLKSKSMQDWFDNNGMMRLNDELRKQKILDDDTKKRLSNVDMLSAPTKKNFLAYRFVSEDTYKNVIKGKEEFYDLGFTHVSVLNDKSNVVGKPVELRINVPKGTKGFFTHNIDESEFILDRGTSFKVLSEAVENGKTIVYLEVKMPEVITPDANIVVEMKDAHSKHSYASPKVTTRTCTTLNRVETFDEIVQRVGGADDTNGSCVSLALAYIGRKKGIDVLDFRGGTSCSMFAKNSIGKGTLRKFYPSKQVTLDGKHAPLTRTVLGDKYAEKVEILNKIDEWMLENAEDKKEYLCIAGNHASIIRVNKSFVNYKGDVIPRTEYLELQARANKNGWDLYTPSRFTGHFHALDKADDYLLVPIDDWLTQEELAGILEYINNEPNKQKKNSRYGGIK